MSVYEAAMAGMAATQALWGYNRSNFMYDKRQRQLMEFRVLEYKAVQAKLWREDVRDIAELTQRKMDNYLVVSTLLLDVCLGLFVTGRLERGTPPWFMHFYYLTLGSAFAYLLMCIWLALHASIIAQSVSVRTLTQFVRLPIPAWEDLEKTRTYAKEFENLGVGKMLKLPFVGRKSQPHEYDDISRVPSQASCISGERSIDEPTTADPWQTELHGAARELYELTPMPSSLRRHIAIARRAALQYQSLDAFSRVAMTFGVNQFLMAISYYFLGQIGYRSGSPWPAYCAIFVCMAVAFGLVQLDFKLSPGDRKKAWLLLLGGPTCAARALHLWAHEEYNLEVMIWVCLGFCFHAMWLAFAVRMCGIKTQPNGAILPMKLRAVLYLDVFGWLSPADVDGQSASSEFHRQLSEAPPRPLSELRGQHSRNHVGGFDRQCSVNACPLQFTHRELNDMEEGGMERLWRLQQNSAGRATPSQALDKWRREMARQQPKRTFSGALSREARAVKQPGLALCRDGAEPAGHRHVNFSLPSPSPSSKSRERQLNASGEISEAPAHAFNPETFSPFRQSGKQTVDYQRPDKQPAHTFRWMTRFLLVMWVFGSTLRFGAQWQRMVDHGNTHGTPFLLPGHGPRCLEDPRLGLLTARPALRRRVS